MPEMTEQDIARICRDAAQNAVAEFAQQHPCRLNDGERGLVHALHEMTSEEGANHGTWRVIIQTGKGWQDVTRKARNMGLAILFIIVILFGATWLGKGVAGMLAR